MLKKVYIEITNSCNLKCPFCIGTKQAKRFLDMDQFTFILEKLKNHTEYLYFHILGEPLMHPNINEFIEKAYEYGYKVNITTNGFLIDRLKSNKVRQLNISLHSANEEIVNLDEYMTNIFDKVDTLKDTIISYRMWVDSPNQAKFLDLINGHYHSKATSFDNVKIKDKVFLSSFHKFIWPDLENDYYNECGRCYALKDHIGILSNGDIVPCCLDTKGDIKLGNIFEDNIAEILKSEHAIKMLENFRNNKKIEELCKHCSFLE